MLSDIDILKAIEDKDIDVLPFRRDLLQPASLDLLLSEDFAQFNSSINSPLDPTNSILEKEMKKFKVRRGDYYKLESGEFMLASTEEIIKIGETIAARFEGKSTLGRCGLLTHVTAGFVDPGFRGRLTLELFNLSGRTILLRPGMPIGQLSFFKLHTKCSVGYGHSDLGSRYNEQKTVQPAKPLKIYEKK